MITNWLLAAEDAEHGLTWGELTDWVDAVRASDEGMHTLADSTRVRARTRGRTSRNGQLTVMLSVWSDDLPDS
jgi:hypothetical protein